MLSVNIFFRWFLLGYRSITEDCDNLLQVSRGGVCECREVYYPLGRRCSILRSEYPFELNHQYFLILFFLFFLFVQMHRVHLNHKKFSEYNFAWSVLIENFWAMSFRCLQRISMRWWTVGDIGRLMSHIVNYSVRAPFRHSDTLGCLLALIQTIL